MVNAMDPLSNNYLTTMKANEILFDVTPPTLMPPPEDYVAFRFVGGRGVLVGADDTIQPLGGPLVPGTPVSGVKATLTIDPTGTNNSILYTAVNAGVAGNAINVRYAISGSGSAVTSVTVSANDILVIAGSATTAQSVITAINGNAAAAALVVAAASGTVSGTIAAVAKTNLTGGIDGTPAKKWDQLVDSSFLYIATADLTITSTSGWKKTALSAL